MQKHEFLQLATIEAMHRFYHDQCFDPKTGKQLDTEEAMEIISVYRNMVCLRPSWRYLLKKKAERYFGTGMTISMEIECRPKGNMILVTEHSIFNLDETGF